ncbi:unnamed protein product, partial [Mesorhabditis belari]|uniref:Uncharacterized protein n=1 Tax=Mesorhabditis belari TaxID=2138241 RepID=A0AAF3F5G5_9BILA
MRGEIEVNYLMKFDEWTSWDLSEIENPLIGTNFSATLLNLDSPKGNRKLNSETLPKTFTKITSLLSTRSLYVNFRLPKSGIGVVNDGFCQEPSKFCRYSLSFHHFERHCSDVGIPVFGLGSPIEEKNRLMLSLNQPIPKCALYFTNDRRFSFCGNISEVKLSIVHIGSSPLTIIDFPQFVSRQSKLRNIRSLEDFPSNEEIDLLLLELSASFWSKNFSLSRFSKVKQISVSLRLFVEEGENYRHFYSFVRCMRENFQLTFGEWKDDHGFLQIQAIFEALAN